MITQIVMGIIVYGLGNDTQNKLATTASLPNQGNLAVYCILKNSLTRGQTFFGVNTFSSKRNIKDVELFFKPDIV